jgi:hypothetical protein
MTKTPGEFGPPKPITKAERAAWPVARKLGCADKRRARVAIAFAAPLGLFADFQNRH